MHIFIILGLALISSSLLASAVLWQYTKSRKDSIGIVLFNWVSILILVNGVVTYLIMAINFEVKS